MTWRLGEDLVALVCLTVPAARRLGVDRLEVTFLAAETFLFFLEAFFALSEAVDTFLASGFLATRDLVFGAARAFRVVLTFRLVAAVRLAGVLGFG